MSHLERYKFTGVSPFIPTYMYDLHEGNSPCEENMSLQENVLPTILVFFIIELPIKPLSYRQAFFLYSVAGNQG